MLKDELPDDLVAFLESDRRLEYDASAGEMGAFTFRTLDEIEEIDLAVRLRGQESTGTVRALDLLKAEGYDARGMLVYIPSLRKYGSYDRAGGSLTTYRDMSWSAFLADPARYIRAAWRLDSEIAEATFADGATDRIVEVYSAVDRLEANGICEILAEKGIGSEIVGEGLGGAAGRLPYGETVAPRIWVREGDARRAREIIAEWTNRPRRDRSRPAELAEGDSDAEPEAELEPAPESEWEEGAEVLSRCLSLVLLMAAGACVLTGAVWARLNSATIGQYPATAEGLLVADAGRQPRDGRPKPHQRPGTSDRRDLRYAFVVDGKTYYAPIDNRNIKDRRMLIHYDPNHPEKNVAGALTPPWTIVTWALGIGAVLAYCGFRCGRSHPARAE